MPSWKFVDYQVEDQVCTITMNRPDRRNAVDGEFARELRAAFEQFESDSSAKVGIFTGSNGHFCAGADLTSISDPTRQNELDPEGGGTGPMGPTRLALGKPLIAAVNGYAVAGGLELALLADMRIADEDAVFGVFCRRWGVPLIDGGTVRLPRIVGMGRAMDMILTGRAVKAPEAYAIGLVNRITEKGGALAAARAIALDITAFPQGCMLADRQSAYEQWDMPLAEALRNEGRKGTPWVHDEGAHGAARFAGGEGRHGTFDP